MIASTRLLSWISLCKLEQMRIKFAGYLLVVVLLNLSIIFYPFYVSQLRFVWIIYVMAFWIPIVAFINALLIFTLRKLSRNTSIGLPSELWLLIYSLILISLFVIWRFY